MTKTAGARARSVPCAKRALRPSRARHTPAAPRTSERVSPSPEACRAWDSADIPPSPRARRWSVSCTVRPAHGRDERAMALAMNLWALLVAAGAAPGDGRLLLCRPQILGDAALTRSDAVAAAARALGSRFLD